MSFVQTLTVWILFAALAAPLLCVAWNARELAHETELAADYEPRTTAKGPLIEHGDGTSTQTITVSVLTAITASHTEKLGPLSVSVNARRWAANAVLIGLFVTLTGLVGLLHFPTGAANFSIAPQSDNPANVDGE